MEELARLFHRQYRHNLDNAPTRLDLQNMEMKPGQSFKSYATEWRSRANCMDPPLGQSEAVPLFIGTLRGIYYSHMMGHTTADFSALIMTGEMIERGIRSGRIEDPSKVQAELKKAAPKRITPTVGMVHPGPYPTPYQPYQPQPMAQASQAPRPQQAPGPPPILQNPSNQGDFQRRFPEPRRPARQFTPLPYPLVDLYRRAKAQGLIGPEFLGPGSRIAATDPNAKCEFHMGAPGHATNDCPRLKHKIQDLLDHKMLILNPVPPPNVNTNPLPNHASGSVNMIHLEEESSAMAAPVSFWVPEDYIPVCPPLVVDFVPRNTGSYASSKSVPWDYTTPSEGPASGQEVFSMTRSGRCYVQPEAPSKGKEVEVAPKKRVTDEEAAAFMRIVKDSEYKVVDQLRKTPAQISLLALLLSSDLHREALTNVLKEALVPEAISPNQVENLVGSVFSGQIAFGDEELGSEGQQHVKALHIVCKSRGYVLSRVMIDNGSALNVCPMSTLQQMKVESALIRPTKSIVRAFDGNTREVHGEIDLPLEIGPCTFNVTFKVLDIPGVYSLLLGRPWIHAAGAVPSTLHQKVKFITEGRIVIIDGEEEYNIYKETAVPFIDNEGEDPLPFHSFELVSVIRDLGEPAPVRAELMVGKIMLGSSFTPGHGLGIKGQGIVHPVALRENQGRFGLGYEPNPRDYKSARRGRMSGNPRPMSFPPLAVTFPGPPHLLCPDVIDNLSGQFSASAIIAALIDEVPLGPFVHPAGSDGNVTNWISLPVYTLSVNRYE